MFNFKNLKIMLDLGLVELNAQEKKEVEGGFLSFIIILLLMSPRAY